MKLVVLGTLVTTFLVTTACKKLIDSDSDVKIMRASGKSTPGYIYKGPMPRMRNVEIYVSTKSNTMRVIGYPTDANAAAQTPWLNRASDGRYFVVYPVGTARSGKTNADVSGAKTFKFTQIRPRRSQSVYEGKPTDQHGLPFLNYQGSIAIHGPASLMKNYSQWMKLSRGDVSAGCTRMEGEHVIELAHIVGIDMSKYYSVDSSIPSSTANRNLSGIKIFNNWDMIDGTIVDSVFAPVNRTGTAGVKWYPTWDASQIPQYICTYNSQQEASNCWGQQANNQQQYTQQQYQQQYQQPATQQSSGRNWPWQRK